MGSWVVVLVSAGVVASQPEAAAGRLAGPASLLAAPAPQSAPLDLFRALTSGEGDDPTSLESCRLWLSMRGPSGRCRLDTPSWSMTSQLDLRSRSRLTVRIDPGNDLRWELFLQHSEWNRVDVFIRPILAPRRWAMPIRRLPRWGRHQPGPRDLERFRFPASPSLASW